MAQMRRHKSEPFSRRKRAGNGTAAVPETPMLLTRQIVDSEPLGLSVAHSFAEALAHHSSDHSETDPESAATGSITQIVIPNSTPELLAEVASAWELHPVLVEDLFHANQRPKVERYDDVL
ncbi:MAG: magnesium and cobalt transport protein CorA, partial [Brevibacterium aurantiacum]